MNEYGLRAIFLHIQSKLGQENPLIIAREMRRHCPSDTGFEIRALALSDQARHKTFGHGGLNTRV